VPTLTVPCIDAWILQWYATVRAALNVREYESPGFMHSGGQAGLESKDPSSAVTVWGTALDSVFFQVTVSPTATWIEAGE